MQLVEKKARFYCQEIRKGVELFTDFKEGLKEVIVPELKAALYNDSFYLIDDLDSRINIKEGKLVMTSKGEGTVIEFADVIALVQVEGFEKAETFYIKDLQYPKVEKYLKALGDFNEVKKTVDENTLETNTKVAKEYFEKGIFRKTGENPEKDIKKLETPATKFETPGLETKPIETPSPSVDKLRNKLKGTETVFSKKFVPTKLHSTTPAGELKETSFVRKEIPSKEPVLSHIRLNPEGKGESDKYIFTQKVRGKHEKTTTPPENHPALGGKIYLKGERVNVEGEKDEHDVVSHINPLPGTHTVGEYGKPDFSQMLVKNKKGQTISVDRSKAKLVGPDLTKVKQVELMDGSKKYYHHLVPGDQIKKWGIAHEVVAFEPEGLWTYSKEREKMGPGSLHFQHIDDWDKPYRHEEFDRSKSAEERDIIQFTHNGAMKKRPVDKVTDEGAVVKINKQEPPVLIKHGEYSQTGYKNYEQIGDEAQKKTGDYSLTSAVKLSEYGVKQGAGKVDDGMKKWVKEHNIAKDKDSTTYKLGISNVSIKMTGDKAEIQSGEFSHRIGKKNQFYEILDFDPNTGDISYKEWGEGKPYPQKKNPTQLNIDRFKTMLGQRESLQKKPEERQASSGYDKDMESNIQQGLANKIASSIGEHGQIDESGKPYENWHEHPELKEAVSSHIKDYVDEIHKHRAGEGIVEADYKPLDKLNIEEHGTDATLSHYLGEDWKKKIENTISKRKESKKESEKSAKKQEKQEEIYKEQEKVAKEKAGRSEKDYIEKVYNKLPHAHERSLNQKLDITGEGKFNIKHEKGKDLGYETHLIPVKDVIASHKAPDNLPKEGGHKIPWPEETNFPEGVQGRKGYGSSNDPKKERKYHTDLVSEDRYNPAEEDPIGIDEKMVAIDGTGRTNTHRMLKPEQLKAKTEFIKDHLNDYFPGITDEQKKQLSSEIDKVDGGVMVSRLIKHPSGEHLNFEKHTDDYKGLARLFNKDVSKKGAGAEATTYMPEEHKESLRKILHGKNVDKLNVDVGRQVSDLAKRSGLFESDELADWFKTTGKEVSVSDKGKSAIKTMLKTTFLDEKHEQALRKLPIAKRDDIESFIEDHIGALHNIHSVNEAYSLSNELQKIIAKRSQKGEGKGLLKDDPVVTHMENLLKLKKEDRGKILKKYSAQVETEKERFRSAQGSLLAMKTMPEKEFKTKMLGSLLKEHYPETKKSFFERLFEPFYKETPIIVIDA